MTVLRAPRRSQGLFTPERQNVITLRDIAKEAGVSAMTVSNVINGRHTKVGPDTIKRVREAIEKLGFVPNASARVLTTERSNIIALVYPADPEPLANQHDAAFVGAVERQVSGGDRHLMIRAADDVVKAADNLRTWRVDGAVVYGTFGSEVDGLLHRRLKVPIVFVDNYSDSPDVDRVGINDYQGGRLAAQHLLAKGHRRLGFVGPSRHGPGVVHERFRGFEEVAMAAGATIRPFERGPRFEDGQELARELSTELASGPGTERDVPTGFFATADILAIGLLNGFLSSGVDVPGEVSVIGFDDIPQAVHGLHPLTTIRQDVGAKARAAVDRLLERIDSEAKPGDRVTLDVELVERGTVGPPRS
jgi:LacI family transcriptional regulator